MLQCMGHKELDMTGGLNSSVQFSCSVVSDSLRPMNWSTPGLPVHHNNINNMCVFSYNWVLDGAPLSDM